MISNKNFSWVYIFFWKNKTKKVEGNIRCQVCARCTYHTTRSPESDETNIEQVLVSLFTLERLTAGYFPSPLFFAASFDMLYEESRSTWVNSFLGKPVWIVQENVVLIKQRRTLTGLSVVRLEKQKMNEVF